MPIPQDTDESLPSFLTAAQAEAKKRKKIKTAAEKAAEDYEDKPDPPAMVIGGY